MLTLKQPLRFSILYFLLSAFCLHLCSSAFIGGPLYAQTRKERVDLLVSGGTVVTMDADRHIIEDGAVAIRGDSIVAVGPSAEVFAKYAARRRIDARGRIVLPGLINTHGHAPMTLMRGLADDLTLQEWLTKYIFPAEARNVTEDYVEWGTKLAIIEMIRGGTTTYADMYYFEDAMARVTKAAGMRAVLGETLLDFPAPDNKTREQALAYTEEFLKHWQGDPLIRAAVAPHAIYTNSEKSLRDAFGLARRYNAPVLIHLSETKKENDDSQAQHGVSPSAYLEKLGLLGPDVLAAHCVWLDANDIAILTRREVGCSHNPSSNMKLGSGAAPVVDMLAAGMRVGIGTDGPAGSNNDLNLMEEMDLAAKLQKVIRRDPQALPATQALEMATIGGARSLHMEKEIGSLEAGKKADLILIRIDAPHAVPMYNLNSHLVFALKASDVETVVIGGRIVMRNRRVLTLNEAEVLAKAREYAAKVKQSLATGKN